MVKLRKNAQVQQQEMGTVKINQGHAKRLFAQQPVWKSLLIVAFPSIMIAFVSGLFIFISQVLLIDLIPLIHTGANVNPNDWLWGGKNNEWGWTYNQFVSAIHQWDEAHPTKFVPVYRLQDVIKSANSFATPIMMLVTATVLLASQGAAVIYSKTLGIKQYRHATDVYYESIIVSFVFCALMLIILYGVAKTWIKSEAQLPNDYATIGGANGPQLIWFYQHFAHVTIKWSVDFIYVYMVSTFLQSYTLICTYFLNSEGRNNITMLIVTFSNFLGIFMTFVLIYWAKMAELYGSAIAFSISYTVNVVLFLIYMDHLERKRLTCLCTKPKAITNWDWQEVWLIIYIGLGNFFKNMSIAFTASFSLQILNGVNEHFNGASQALFYSSVNGIVLPLYNLMYLAMIGVVRGARSVTSYVYGAHDFKKVRETYWYTVLYTTIWSTFLFFLVVFLLAGYKMPGEWGTHGPFILIFNLHYNQAPLQYLQSQYLLMIYMLQLVFFGFANAGELLFQACEKPFWGIIVSLTLGVFVLFPVLFIMRAISFHVGSVTPTLWVPMVDGVVSSAVVGIISVTYMYTTFKKEEKRKIKEDHIKLFRRASVALMELERSITRLHAKSNGVQEIDVNDYRIISENILPPVSEENVVTK